MLAVLKAGAAYLPLDTEYPADRISFMLSDADPVLVLTTGEMADRLPGSDTPRVVLDAASTPRQLAACPDVDVGSDEGYPEPSLSHPPYLLDTSGATGRPTGVGLP